MKLPLIRCSNLDMLLGCPGSRELSKVLPPPEDHEVTTEGNIAHYRAAKRLIEKHGATCEEELAEPQPPFGFKEPDMLSWVTNFYVDEVVESSEGMALLVELHLAYSFAKAFALSGHLDALAVSEDGKRAIIFDFKAGYLVVDPAECNWQLTGYYVLLRQAYPNLEEVTLKLVQPRNRESDNIPRVSEITISDLGPQVQKTLVEHCQYALKNWRQLETGKHCRYCPAALSFACPALHELYDEMKATLSQEFLDDLKKNGVSTERLAEVAVSAKILDAPLKAVKEALKERAKDSPLEFGEHKIFVRRDNGKRFFSNNAEGWERVVELLDPERAYACMSLSVTDIEKQIKEQYELPMSSKKKESAKSKFTDTFGDIVVQPKVDKLIIQ